MRTINVPIINNNFKTTNNDHKLDLSRLLKNRNIGEVIIIDDNMHFAQNYWQNTIPLISNLAISTDIQLI